jgi:hypothetical protein
MDANDLKMIAELVSTSQHKLAEELTAKFEALVSNRPGVLATGKEESPPVETLKLEPGIYTLTKGRAEPVR